MDDLSREGAYNHVREPASLTERGLGRISWLFSLVALGLVFVGLYSLERDAGHVPAGLTEAEAGAMSAGFASVRAGGDLPGEPFAAGFAGERASAEPAGAESVPAAAEAGAPPEKPAFTYRVPEPGDADYADYREMLAHPKFRSSLENTPGYEIPYDPEWRSVITGRREVGPTDLQLIGGAGSLKELGESVLLGLEEGDRQALTDLAVIRDEYRYLLWPEFPQSRPYLRIPAAEAWYFHTTKCTKGISILLRAYGSRRLTLAGITVAEVRPFTNFTLHEGVVLHVVDQDTGEEDDIRNVSAVVERQGRFKIFMAES